jgi:predicted HD phosphohydrolase
MDRMRTPAERAAALLERLAAAGERDYIGERVSQLEHALQCAALAQDANADDELVLAALFHDVGHLEDGADDMDGLGAVDHEGSGADVLLAHGCSFRVGALVRDHVAAKRYLCAVKPTYYERLSEASKGTLAMQGGPMSEDEARAFARREDLHELLALRSWDDRAKMDRADVPGLESYWPMLVEHLSRKDRT